MAVDRKYERDIDLLLAEEAAVSAEFADWLLGQTGFADIQAAVVDVFVSRSDATGESDLVIIFEEANGSRRFALLIEDKIDAPLQPDQEKRYRLRAQREIDRGDYQAFEVLLCAPQSYAASHPETADFDRIVSYEAIAAFIKSRDTSLRAKYRSNFIATAAARNANTWTRVDDVTTNAFWNAAYGLATAEFPMLEMRPRALTKDSTWITIRPQDMPTKPVWTYVSLKGDRGYIDLTFTGTDFVKFQELIAPILDSSMRIEGTGKSAAIRIQVEGFKISKDLEVGASKIRRAFAASAELIAFYRKYRRELDQAALASLSAPGTA